MRLLTQRMLRAVIWTSVALGQLAAVSAASSKQASEPLVVGETFYVDSKVLSERRRINVYTPAGSVASQPLPVLYMPDGGVAEDFMHIAGLVQVSVANRTMRPFLLVGIENTERRRDLTPPTQNESDRKIAPRVGESSAFRRFIRQELIPEIKARYRTADEAAVMGESLAGLFVIETLLVEPALFDTYIAFDPSLWWNDHQLLRSATERLGDRALRDKRLFLAGSGEKGLVELTDRLAAVLDASAPAALHWHYERMPEEKHSTIFHPAALKAFRTLFGPSTATTEAR